MTGERCSLAFTPDQLGFYTLGSPRPAYAFAINAATDQSDLRPMDKKRSARGICRLITRRISWPAADDYDELARGRPIFHWFVLAALAVLLLESGFQFFIRRRPA